MAINISDIIGLSVGATKLTELTDAPSTYSGQAGKVLVVNSDETGTEFGSAPASVAALTDLDDFPSSYTGQAGKVVIVNDSETGTKLIAPEFIGVPYDIHIACSDEETPLEDGKKTTIRAVRDFVISEVCASLTVPHSDETSIKMWILVNGETYVFGGDVMLHLESGDEFISKPVDNFEVTRGDKLEIFIEDVTEGTAAAGLKVYIVGQTRQK